MLGEWSSRQELFSPTRPSQAKDGWMSSRCLTSSSVAESGRRPGAAACANSGRRGMGRIPRKCKLRGPCGVTSRCPPGTLYISPGPNWENPAVFLPTSFSKFRQNLLSRNRLRSLPGEAHVRNFYFCKFPTVLVVSYLFSFFISIFCFSDFQNTLFDMF